MDCSYGTTKQKTEATLNQLHQPRDAQRLGPSGGGSPWEGAWSERRGPGRHSLGGVARGGELKTGPGEVWLERRGSRGRYGLENVAGEVGFGRQAGLDSST